MNVMRLIKTIDTTNLYELAPYVGQRVEIIIFPLSDEREEDVDDIECRRRKFFNMIDQYTGTISPWTREELHAR